MKWSRIITLSLLTPSLMSAEVLDFVVIEGGAFLRGRPRDVSVKSIEPLASTPQYFGDNESPEHVAILTKRYEMSRTEVTVDQFERFVAETGYVTTGERSGSGIVGWQPSETAPHEEGVKWDSEVYDLQLSSDLSWRSPGFEQSGDHPVVGVSWEDAVAYCEWLTEVSGRRHRLPTAAEWEFAAKARSFRDAYRYYPWGNQGRGEIHRRANIANVELEKHRSGAASRHWIVDTESGDEDGFVFTSPVGSYPADSYGLHDMIGNVWEWTADSYLDTAYGEWLTVSGKADYVQAIDPFISEHTDKETPLREIRGGSWYGGPLLARAEVRAGYDEAAASCYIGFRVVREVEGADNGALEEFENALKVVRANGGSFRALNRDTQLSFGRGEISSAVVEVLPFLPRVSSISMRVEEYSNEVFERLAELGAGVESLLLEGSMGTAVDLQALANLSDQLRRLRLPDGVGPAQLDQVARLTNMESLQLNFGEGSLVTDRDIAKLAANKGLEDLQLGNCNRVTGAFLKAFGGLPVKRLVMSYSSEDVQIDLSGLEGLSKLRGLQLYPRRFQDETLLPLHVLSELTGLTIDGGVQDASASDGAIAALLQQLPKLERLTLKDTLAGDASAEVIGRMHYLKELRMSRPYLSGEGLRAISKSRSLSSIGLSRDCTGVSAAGVAELWRIPRLESLSVESLSGAGPELIDLRAAKQLRILQLPLAGLPHDFESTLVRMPKLERLVLLDSKAEGGSPELVERIRAALPVLEVQLR